MWAKVWKVKVVHCVSAIKIYDTFDRSIVKTNRRLFVAFSILKHAIFPSLHSKRFQSSYCTKVRARAQLSRQMRMETLATQAKFFRLY